MLRLLIAGVAGLVAFFLVFILATMLTGSNVIGSILGLLLGFLGVPALILRRWATRSVSREPSELVKRSWNRSPRCLSDVVATPVTDADALRKIPSTFAHFDLTCRCANSTLEVLGFIPERNLVLCPLSLRCPSCQRTAEIFDSEKHGYDAEVGNGSAARRAEGNQEQISCAKCRGSSFQTTAVLGYQIDTDDLDEETDKPLPDLFDVFALRVTCTSCGREADVCEYECA